MKALVTGARGALGYSLVKLLCSKRLEVIVTHRQARSFYDFDETNSVRYVECDLLDFNKIRSTLFDIKPDVIFHLAADNDNRANNSRISEILVTNITTTLNLLNAARMLQRLPLVIVASSTEVEMLFSKNATFTPYRTSKLVSELLAKCFCEMDSLKVRIVRLPNIYGAGDLNFSRLVPGLIRASIEGTPVSIINPRAKRHFVYSDCAADVLYKISITMDKKHKDSLFYLKSSSAISITRMQSLIKAAYMLTKGESVHRASLKCSENLKRRLSLKNSKSTEIDDYFICILETVRWYVTFLTRGAKFNRIPPKDSPDYRV